ncbi:E3 ubiquitin-protein ligase SH3RF2 isoform X2 [Esox lucius]|uniref:SH3 domain containing ring finger 2 n=1 Tax=Esox lucius TaxID=8010 RepID=A0A3P8Z903_ESOLU|nr:E3 ubiquitin-protein ligase SH3RF2 isoform X2 [Esox lucius]
MLKFGLDGWDYDVTEAKPCTYLKMEELALLDLLQCPQCFERLDISAKVLPCQHTFCKPCLWRSETSKSEGQILTHCPECRTPVQARSVEELPPNLLLVRLLEGLSQGSMGPERDGHKDRSRDRKYSRYMVPSVGKNGLPREIQQLSSYQSTQSREMQPGQNEQTQSQPRSQYQMEPESQAQPVALCRALFDFDSKEMDVDLGESKDCLTFLKGDLLTVTRRVDENWIEGKLGDKVGIFPLKFTEPNTAATAKLLEGRTRQGSNSSAESQIGSGLSNLAPGDIPNPNGTAHSGEPQSPTRNPNIAAFNLPVNIPGKSQASLSSALYQRNQTQSSYSTGLYKSNQAQQPAHIAAAFQSTAGQGQLSGVSSLNSLNRQQGHQGHRSLPNHPRVPPAPLGSTHPSAVTSQRVKRSSESAARRQSQHGERKMSSGEAPPTITMALINPQNPSGSTDSKQSSTQQLSISVCAALYSYKPRRSEELELRKGEMVGVYGKFKEGWLRGLSLRTGKVGILPGNYVTPVLRTSARLLESKAVTAGPGTIPGKRTTSSKTPAMVLALDRVNSDGTGYPIGQHVPPVSIATQPVSSSGGATRQSLHGVGSKGWDTVRRVFRGSHRGSSHRGKQYSHTISSSSALQTHSQNSSQRGNHYPPTTNATSGLQPHTQSQNFSHIQAPGYSPALLRRKQHMSILPNHNRSLAWMSEGPPPSSGGFMKDRDTAAKEAFDKQVLETKQAALNGNGPNTIHSILVKPDAHKNSTEKPAKSVRFVTQPDSPPPRPRTTSLPSGSQPPSSTRPGPLPLEVWAPSLTLGRDGPGIILKEGKAPVLRKGLETYPSVSDSLTSNQKTTTTSSSSSSSVPSASVQSNSPSRHRVATAYQAQAESEMSLKQGEPVLLHRHRPDGRVLLTQESSGHTGLFHSSVLQYLDRFS